MRLAFGKDWSSKERTRSYFSIWDSESSHHMQIWAIPNRTIISSYHKESQGTISYHEGLDKGKAINSSDQTSCHQQVWKVWGRIFGFDHCLCKALQLEAREEVRTKYQLWKEIRTAHMTAARSRWHLRDSVSCPELPAQLFWDRWDGDPREGPSPRALREQPATQRHFITSGTVHRPHRVVIPQSSL